MTTNPNVDAVLKHTVATLGAALIAASGRPHSVNEAVELMHDFEFRLNPVPGNGRYEEWKKKFDGDKPHK
jgi:hypothetical protein